MKTKFRISNFTKQTGGVIIQLLINSWRRTLRRARHRHMHNYMDHVSALRV